MHPMTPANVNANALGTTFCLTVISLKILYRTDYLSWLDGAYQPIGRMGSGKVRVRPDILLGEEAGARQEHGQSRLTFERPVVYFALSAV
jgi:hypothetical protein